jgi:hypothetical protein
MLRIFHSDALWKQSNAFWKSTKVMTRFNCLSVDSSMIVLYVKMWSVIERCGLKPACSSLSFSSMDFLIFSSTMLRKTFTGIDSSVIPRQLLQSANYPFLVVSRCFHFSIVLVVILPITARCFRKIDTAGALYSIRMTPGRQLDG